MITKLNISILSILFSIAFMACDTNIEKMYINVTNAVAPPLLKSEGLTEIIIDETNINLSPIVLNWTGSDFGKNVIVEYSLEMATDASFNNSFKVTIGNNTFSKTLSCSDLNTWVIANFNGLNANDLPVRVNLFMRVYATIALENPTVTNPPDTVYSNTLLISVVPYNIPDSYPEEMLLALATTLTRPAELDAVILTFPPASGFAAIVIEPFVRTSLVIGLQSHLNDTLLWPDKSIDVICLRKQSILCNRVHPFTFS